MKQPPSEVKVGQIFQVQVKATVAEGNPISRAVVYCNVSLNVEFNSLSSADSTLKSSTNITKAGVEANYDKETQEMYMKALEINPDEVNVLDPESLFMSLHKKIVELKIPPSMTDSLMNEYLKLFLSNVDKQNFFSLYGQGDVEPSSISSLSKRTNVKLEVNRGFARTDKKGIATLTLRFISGRPGSYMLICQSGNTRGPKSQSINLTNPIKEITFMSDAKQTVPIEFEKGERDELMPTFSPPLNNSLKFSLWQDNGQPYVGDVYDLDIKMIKYQDVLAAMNTIKTDTNNFSLTDLILIQSFGQTKNTPGDKISRLWSILTTGGNSLKYVLGKGENLKFENKELRREAQAKNNYDISGLRMEFALPGEYQLVVSINGVESKLSGVIKVENYEKKTTFVKILPILSPLVIYTLCVIICIANIMHSNSLWAVLAGLLAIFGIVLFANPKVYQPFFLIIMLATLTIIVINMVGVIVLRFVGNGEALSDYEIRKAIYHEYTYQRIFKHPSNSWVSLPANTNL